MAELDKQHVHCLVTWINLVDLDQPSRGFDSTGSAKISQLSCFNPSDSQALRKGKARTIAIQSDTLSKRHWGATYEDGKSCTKAINAAVRVLVQDDKTVADLAEANNKYYLFFGEG